MLLPQSVQIHNIRRQRDATANQVGVGNKNYQIQITELEYAFLKRKRGFTVFPVSRLTVLRPPTTPSIARLVNI